MPIIPYTKGNATGIGKSSLPICLLLLVCLSLAFSIAPFSPVEARQTGITKTKSPGGKALNPAKQKKRPQKSSARQKMTVADGNNYKGAVVYDAEKQEIVFSRRPEEKVPPASLTKILSMYVAFDAVKTKKVNLSSLVPISAKAASTGGSSMGIHEGEMIPLRELLKGMAICSGNDASVAVAEYIGSSEEGFVMLMNAKAQQLGMRDSVFKNAHGLHTSGQHTTAMDMLTLARNYLAEYPQHLELYHCNTRYTYKGKTAYNANSLLGKYEGVNGLKTGFVAAAGYNLITTAHRNGSRCIAVVLGSPTSKVREQEVASLLDAYLPKATIAPDVQPVVSHHELSLLPPVSYTKPDHGNPKTN